MNINPLEPFCDWLSISFPTSLSPTHTLLGFLVSLDSLEPLKYTDYGGGKEVYKSKHGSVFVTSKETYTNFSISGGLLRLVRESDSVSEFIQILLESPHNITRLDAAMDLPVSGSIFLENIRLTYPTGFAKIAGKERRIKYLTSQISPTENTGTAYFQTPKYKGTVKLRVYDKAEEVLEKTGLTIPATTRIEFEILRGCSLRDFTNPADVFFHFCPTELLQPPKHLKIAPWKASERISYDLSVQGTFTDYQRLKCNIESSPALKTLIEDARTVIGGEKLLLRLIRQEFFEDGEAMQRSGNDCDLKTSATPQIQL